MRLLTALASIALFTTAAPAHAAEWVQYKDENGIFHSLIPENYKINSRVIRLTDNTVAVSSDLTSLVDERTFRDSVSQFAVKYTQTLADTIAKEDIQSLLERDLDRYIGYYKSKGGEILAQEVKHYGGRPGAELVMAYKNDAGSLESIRARILYSDSTKLEQMIVGHPDALNTYRTNDFFTSLSMKDGRTNLSGKFQDEWETTTSPFNLFTVTAPRRTVPFVPESPKISSNDRIERFSMQLFDPVYENLIFYNVYGYRFNTLMNKDTVQRVLLDKHLKKFRVDIRTVGFTPTSNNNFPGMSGKFHFAPPSKYPYMNTIFLNASYYGNFMIVQEMVGNNSHIESNIAKMLRSFITFTPVEANKKLLQDKANKLFDEAKADNFGENNADEPLTENTQSQTKQESEAPAENAPPTEPAPTGATQQQQEQVIAPPVQKIEEVGQNELNKLSAEDAVPAQVE